MSSSPPLSPFSFKGEGGIIERGAIAPLRYADKRLLNKGIKRGETPLRNSLPSPLMKGRGIKGEGLVDSDKGKEED